MTIILSLVTLTAECFVKIKNTWSWHKHMLILSFTD